MKKVKDYYYKLAKEQNYSARSVFKLQEIDEKYQVVKSAQKVLDLGAAPGSWSEYCHKRVGAGGLVISVDLKELQKAVPKNGFYIKGDVFTLTGEEFPDSTGAFDVVLSDMAPNTSGNKGLNHQQSLELCREVIRLCDDFLKEKGIMVCKVFDGEDLQEYIREEVKPRFSRHKLFKPKSTRKESVELYIIGFEYKKP